MGYLPFIFSGLFLLFIITRPFTVLIHELGHALVLLLLTKQGATIFVGSYGNEKHSFKVSIAKLDIWIRYNPLKWKGGLCRPKASNISLVKTFIYVLSGPIFSLITALLLFAYLNEHGLQSGFDFICGFAFIISALDFIVNLFPHQIKAAEDKILFSDGYWLLHCKKLQEGIEAFREGCEEFNKESHTEAARLFTKSIDCGYKIKDSYRLAYLTYLILQDYPNSLLYLQKLEDKFTLNDNDYYHYGYLGFIMKTKIDVDSYFRKALTLNPDNTDALNAVGYRLIEKNAFSEALPYFEKAVQLNPQLSYAWNNRGHAKIETGLLEEGLNDIVHSISLDDSNAYAYRNQGIYHLKKNEHEQAIHLFKKAKLMDENTDLIEELIQQTAANIQPAK